MPTLSTTLRALFLSAATCLAACSGEDASADDGTSSATGDDDGDASHAEEAIASGRVRIETHFTDLRSTDKDMTILDDLVRMIRDTPKGESIRIAVHSITVNAVARAIIDAQTNGVHVYVAHNGEDFRSDDATPKALAAALGPASHRWCGDVAVGGRVGGCISDGKSSIMHAKLVLFSKTKDATGAMRQWVSWFGSANMTFATGAKTYNNTVTVYGDRALYDRFDKGYFAKLWSEDHAPRNDFFDAASHRGYFGSSASGVTVYASPEQDGDLVLRRLAAVAPGKGCEIRVAQAMIHDARLALVERLAALKDGGCDVRVAGNGIESGALRALRRAGIPTAKNHLHDKLLLVHAKYACGDHCDAAKSRKLVFTGSHNWTASANDLNDELLVKVEAPGVYEAYDAHFDAEFSSGERL